MEFLNGIFVEVSEHKLKSSQTRVFVWFSTLFFRSTKWYSYIDSSFLSVVVGLAPNSGFVCRDFFVEILKTREEFGFLPVEETVDSMEQKTWVFW